MDAKIGFEQAANSGMDHPIGRLAGRLGLRLDACVQQSELMQARAAAAIPSLTFFLLLIASAIIATLGLWLRERSWGRRLGQSLIGFTDNPTMWSQLILAIPAKILAFIRQGGRLTVVARKAS